MSQIRFSPVVLPADAEDNQTILRENVDPREEKINFDLSLRIIRHQEAEIHAGVSSWYLLITATRRQRSPPLALFPLI